MRITPLVCLATAGALICLPDAEAHHGWAEFDLNREVTIEGTVTDFHFVNPHCVVEFDAKEHNGSIRKWQGEFSSPGALKRRGWNEASLQPGDPVKIVGNPAKGDVPAIHVLRIRMPGAEEVSVD